MAVAVAFNGTLAVLSYHEHEALFGQALTDVRAQSSTLSGAVENQLDHAERTLLGIADVLSATPEAWEAKSAAAHRLLLRHQSVSPFLQSLFLVGADGQLHATSSTIDPEPLDLSERDYFKAMEAGVRDRLFVGRPVVSRHDGQWVVPIARALDNQQGRLEMVLAGAITTQAVEGLIAAQGFGNGTRVAILLPDGRSIGCRAVPDCAVASDLVADRYPMDRFAEAEGFALDQAYLGGDAGPAAYHRGEKYGLTVVVAADHGTVLKPWRSALPYKLALAASGTAFILLAAAALVRQLKRRIQAMRALTDANASLESDVAERARELQESEERLRGFIQAARDGVIIIDERGIIQEFNPSAAQMFGYAATEVVGRNVGMLMPEEDARHHDRYVAHSETAGQRAIGCTRELFGRRCDGVHFPIELTVGTHFAHGHRVHVGVIRDITERKASEEALRRLANVDGLTGVLNRRHFMEEGERLMSLARRSGRPIAALMLDADHFKSVNDRYGHGVGDSVLKALAETVSANLRDTDILGRLGGEEFAVLLPDTDQAGAEDLTERLLSAIRELRVQADGQSLGFTISAGIALGCREALEDLLKRADSALYDAKHAGRDRAVMAV
jgi:PAS domain S-box/diguanylate cyclase (GGDEF) domain